MARTTEIERSKGRPMLHQQEAEDHEGEMVVRARFSMPDEVVPFDFHEDPVFALQIYSTIHLDLKDRGEPPATRITTLRPWGASVSSLIDYVASHIGERSACPTPVFEIYRPLESVLACVQHQQREIAHRKAARDDPETLLIPRIAAGESDKRRCGFIIVITSLNFKHAPNPNEREIDPEGPLWVHFDRGIHHASPVEEKRHSHDSERSEEKMQAEDERSRAPPEELTLRVVRMQDIADSHSRLARMYRESYSPDGKAGQWDLALDDPEGESSVQDVSAEIRST